MNVFWVYSIPIDRERERDNYAAVVVVIVVVLVIICCYFYVRFLYTHQNSSKLVHIGDYILYISLVALIAKVFCLFENMPR